MGQLISDSDRWYRDREGVVAFGHQIGVQGSSVGGDTGSFFCGVFGESHVGIGVQGHSKNMTGVIGMSDNGNGVQGFGGKQGNGVSGFSDSNVGVTGTSNSDDGIVGISKGDRKSGVFGDHVRHNEGYVWRQWTISVASRIRRQWVLRSWCRRTGDKHDQRRNCWDIEWRPQEWRLWRPHR